jgi:hypothetical protein
LVEELEKRRRMAGIQARGTNGVACGPDVLGSSRQGEGRACEATGQFCPDARKAFLIGRAQAGALDNPAGDANKRCRHRTCSRDASDRSHDLRGHVGAMITGYTGVIVKSIWS